MTAHVLRLNSHTAYGFGALVGAGVAIPSRPFVAVGLLAVAAIVLATQVGDADDPLLGPGGVRREVWRWVDREEVRFEGVDVTGGELKQ